MEANRKLPFRGIKLNLYRFYKISICNRCYFDMKQKYAFNFNFQNKRIKIEKVLEKRTGIIGKIKMSEKSP